MTTNKIAWIYKFVILLIILTVNAAVCSDATELERLRTDFTQKHQEWKFKIDQSLTREHKESSSLDGSLLYDNKEFNAIVDLGIAAIPIVLNELQNDSRLTEFMSRIVKTRFQRDRLTIDNSKQYIWIVDKFPNKQWRNQPPPDRELWRLWLSDGGKPIENLFKVIYQTKTNEDRLDTFFDFGIPVIPHLIEKISAGETEFIPLISDLTDGKVQSDWTARQVIEWWEENRERWTIPFPDSPASPRQRGPSIGR